MHKIIPQSSILVGSPNYPGFKTSEEDLTSPDPSESHDEDLVHLLLKEEIAFNAVEPVEFRQFPSTLYAHTEDGTPFERLKQLTRSKMNKTSGSHKSSQFSKLTEDLQNLITHKLSRQENFKMSTTSDVDSYWNQMLHEVLSENLHSSQISDSLSEQLKETILQQLDDHLRISEASDVDSMCGSFKIFLHDVLSRQNIHGSLKNLLYNELDEHNSIRESVETNLQKSSSQKGSSVNSAEAKIAFEHKLRSLNVQLDISFVEKELERLCKPHSAGNILHRPFESKVNDKFMNQYSLEYADMDFLEKAPKNFIIFCKPGIDTSKLAKKMHDQYGLVILDPKAVLEAELSRPGEVQESLSKQLGRGNCVSSKTLFTFIINEINSSKEIKNKGYILSGIPMFRFCNDVGNDDDDLISAQDQLEAIFAIQNRPNIIIYLYCPDPCLIRLRSLTNTDSNTGYDHNLGISRTVKIHNILQAEYFKRDIDVLENIEEFFEGEEEEDVNIRDHGGDGFIKKDHIFNETHDTNPRYPNLPDKSVLHFILEDFEDASKNLTSSFKSVKSQNLVTNVGLQTVKSFHNDILPIINEYVLLHDLTYYVKLDARLPSSQNFSIIQQWLKNLGYIKPCEAYSLVQSSKIEEKYTESSAEEDEEISEKEGDGTSTTMSMYKKVQYSNCIDSFDWKLSRFGLNCPVSLFNGTCDIGKLIFSATYLDNVYFCKSKTCLEQFMEDPKKYIKEPNPKPTYKLIIVGFTGCDIPTISRKLCEKFHLKYVEFNSLMEKYITIKKNNALYDFKTLAKNKINEAKVFQTIKIKMLEKEISKWKNEFLHTIKLKLSKDHFIEREDQGMEESSSTVGLYEITGPMYGVLNNEELCKLILQNNGLLDEYVPENLEQLVEAKCQEKVEELAEHAVLREFDPRLSLEDIKNAISIIDDSNGIDSPLYFNNDKLPAYRGWVLNGLPIEPKLWNVLRDSNVFKNDFCFIYNSNETPEGENLGEKYQMKQTVSDHGGIDKLLVLPKKEPKNYNGLNRKQLASIQERYMDFPTNDDLSIVQALSSFMIDEEVQEDSQQFENKEQTIKTSKRITFVSQVEIIPYSDKLEYYEINDHILANWTDVKTSVLSDRSDNILEIDVKENTDALGNIENHVLKKYEYPIIDLSDIEKEVDEGSNNDTDGSNIEDLFPFRNLGDTLSFCPVALKEHRQLIQGNIEQRVQFKNKIYNFISAKNKEKFKLNPDLYVHFRKPLDSSDFGPWQVCVLSTICGSGELFCEKLASNLNLTFINFNNVFERDIVPAGILPIGVLYEDPATIFDLAFKDKALLKDLQMLRDYFNNLIPLPNKEYISVLVDRYWSFQHPCSNGFVYYRFPHTVNDFKYLVSKMFIPDVIIELKVPEDLRKSSMLQIKLNWTIHKGAIKNQIILHDQHLKMEYEKVRKRVFRFILDKVWFREINFKEKGTTSLHDDSILERIEAEIEYAKGNTSLLENLFWKYASMNETEDIALSENDANSLFNELDDFSNFVNDYSNIKRLSDPLEHTPSIRNITIRYGLEPKDIDLNVVRQVHKIVCQIVPKPSYKMKTLNQKLNDPEDDVMSTYETELGEIYKIKRVAKKLNIPWITSWPSEDNGTKCSYDLKESLRLKDPNCLEIVYEISMEAAEKLLEVGYFYYSKYGRICPVEYNVSRNSIQPFEKRRKQNEIHALVHRKYIYFIFGEKNRDDFMRNVLEYVKFNSTIDVFYCPIKLAVVGPIKGGKTSLASLLADYYDLEVITTGSALRYVQRNLSWTLLADHIENCLGKGYLVPDILIAKCIEVLIHVGKAPVTGYVLDGVISNENLVLELTKLNIVPHLVIQLTVETKRILTNLKTSAIPKRMLLKYSPDFIKFKLKNSGFPVKHENLIDEIRLTWYNVCSVDPITIQLNLGVITSEINNIFLMLNENYSKMKHSNKGPVKLKHMCVCPYEYEFRLNCLIENCCVGCLVEKKQFVSKCLDRMNSLMYRENYFWLCPIHYEPFLSNPEQFLCKLDPVIFLERPRKITIPKGKGDTKIFLDTAENRGYCNVCFWNCFPNRIPEVNKGLPSFGILYRRKLFLFCCDDCMQTFCLRPEFYHDKQIHCTLPLLSVEQRNHIPPKELPLIGYVHENLAGFLQEALVNVGHVRPKYPFMSPNLSAALYLGYYLATKTKSQRQCITNSFEDQQFRQFLARIDVLKLLVDTVPWNYNPFLIKLWLDEGKMDEWLRRNLKTKGGRFIAAIKALPNECGEPGTCHDRGNALKN